MKTPWQYAETGNEHSHQVALFMWCNMAAQFGVFAANDIGSYIKPSFGKSLPDLDDKIPELKWLFAIKNAGHGDAIRGARSAAEGVKAGVPDLCLPVVQPNFCQGGFCGLYIELKRPFVKGSKNKGVVSVKQIEWQSFLRNQGYAHSICYGWEAARDTILYYLGR